MKSYVGAFLFNPQKNEILLHKRDGNTQVNPHKWAFFGGLIEGDESPEDALIRELQEELSIDVGRSEIVSLCDYWNEEQSTHRHTYYIVSDKKKEDMVLGEGADFEWVPIDQAFDLDLTSKVRDDLRRFVSKL